MLSFPINKNIPHKTPRTKSGIITTILPCVKENSEHKIPQTIAMAIATNGLKFINFFFIIRENCALGKEKIQHLPNDNYILTLSP
jgi:hypothetical protein